MRDLFQAPASVQSVRTLVDGGVKLEVVTQELSPDELATLFGLKGKFGWFVYAERDILPDDIPTVDIDVEAGEKSPSQRIRGKLYHHWKDNTGQKEPFDVYYRKFLAGVEAKIDEMLN